MSEQATTVAAPTYSPAFGGVGRPAARPYPGLASFRDTDEDRALFFGRARERAELLNLVLSDTLVVLFGKSGLGKSSLINTALLDDLRGHRFFPIAARVNDIDVGPSRSVIQSAEQAASACGVEITEQEKKSPIIGNRYDDLWTFFHRSEFRRNGEVVRPILIIDQLEQLFTTYQRGLPAVTEFIDRLADLVRRRVPDELRSRAAARLADQTAQLRKLGVPQPEHSEEREEREELLRLVYEDAGPDIRIVLAIREDYLPELHSLREKIPSILRSSMRLEPLTLEQAREAIEGPSTAAIIAEGARMNFADGVVDIMLRELREKSIGGTTITTDRIEPLQLQILCRFLYERRRGSDALTAAQIKKSGGFFEAVVQHYRRVLRHFSSIRPGPSSRRWPWLDNWVAFHFPRAAIRRLCETGLIDAIGYRASLNAPIVHQRYGVPSEDLDLLVEERLLNREARADTTAYELAHDSLVHPLRTLRTTRRANIITAITIVLIAGYIANGAYSDQRTRRIVADTTATLLDRRAALMQLVSHHTDLDRLNINGLDLTGADLTGAQLKGAHLRRAVLDSARLDSAQLSGADLAGASLRDASLIAADLSKADLSRVLAPGANFSGASLRGTNLRAASLVLANLDSAILDSALVVNADVRAANMRYARGAPILNGTAWWLARRWPDALLDELTRTYGLAKFVTGPVYRRTLDSLTLAIDSAATAVDRRDTAKFVTTGRTVRLATALINRAQFLTLTGNDFDSAYADIRRALQLLPDSSSPVLFDTRGYMLLRQLWGDTAKSDSRRSRALENVARAFELDAGADSTRLGQRYYHLGLAYQVLNDFDPAIRAFQRAATMGYEPTYERLLTPSIGLGLRDRLPSTNTTRDSARSEQQTPSAERSDTLPPPNMGVAVRDTSLEALYPETAAKVRQLLSAAEKAGLRPRIYETYRSPALQLEYYRRGRRGPYGEEPTVTNARYYSSHWCRVAFDLIDSSKGFDVPPSWYDQLGKIAATVGLAWGGNWKFRDVTHFEDPAAVRSPCRVASGIVQPPFR